MRYALIAAALVALLAPATANAGWRVDRATAIARIVWHNPCGGNVRLQWAPPTSDLERGREAWELDCAITFRADRPLSWGRFCTDILHEYGHAANFRDPTNTADPDHSANPRSVMARSATQLPSVVTEMGAHGFEHIEDGVDPRCALRGRPFLIAHDVLP